MERRAPSRVSEARWTILMPFLEANPTLARARGYNNSAQGRADSLRLWQDVSILLNGEGSGTTKSPKEWSIYVSNYKSKLNKIVADINADATGTGGGPPRVTHLSDWDRRFLALLGPGFGQTAPRIMVQPFPDEPSTSRFSQEDESITIFTSMEDNTQTREGITNFELLEVEMQPVVETSQLVREEPVQVASSQPPLPEATEPLLPRRNWQRWQRTRPLAPLDEARRILSQVEMQRAAADAANAQAHQLMAQNLAPLADVANNLGRLASVAERYLEYLLTNMATPELSFNCK